MTYRHSTADFAGITVDAFLDENNNSYATLTSLGAGLGVSRHNMNNWVKRHNKGVIGIAVKVGTRQVPATAYPASVIREFLSYRRSLGDEKAEALTDAIVEAAFDRFAKETNLVSVTAAQNEQTMATIRLELLSKLNTNNKAFNKIIRKSLNKETPAADRAKLKVLYDEMMTLRATATAEELEVASDLSVLDNTIFAVRSMEGKDLSKIDPYYLDIHSCYQSLIVELRTKLQAQGVSC
jgi:hypothetical protein